MTDGGSEYGGVRHSNDRDSQISVVFENYINVPLIDNQDVSFFCISIGTLKLSVSFSVAISGHFHDIHNIANATVFYSG